MEHICGQEQACRDMRVGTGQAKKAHGEAIENTGVEQHFCKWPDMVSANLQKQVSSVKVEGLVHGEPCARQLSCRTGMQTCGECGSVQGSTPLVCCVCRERLDGERLVIVTKVLVPESALRC